MSDNIQTEHEKPPVVEASELPALLHTRLAKVGDTVVCRCGYPEPYTITMNLNTPAAVADVNDDLMSDTPMWELVGV